MKERTDTRVERDELKWQAESIVKTAISKTPAFRKAVKETIKQIQATEKNAQKLVSGKHK